MLRDLPGLHCLGIPRTIDGNKNSNNTIVENLGCIFPELVKC
jgi:hypothetical protein